MEREQRRIIENKKEREERKKKESWNEIKWETGNGRKKRKW
jgi:hypothetical protein